VPVLGYIDTHNHMLLRLADPLPQLTELRKPAIIVSFHGNLLVQYFDAGTSIRY
jgi:hypothetical protein